MKNPLLLLCLIAALTSCHHKESKTTEGSTNNAPGEVKSQSVAAALQNDFKKPVYNKEVKHTPDDVVLTEDSGTTHFANASSAISGSKVFTYSVGTTTNYAASNNHDDASAPPATDFKLSLASAGNTPPPPPANNVTQTVWTKDPSQIIKNATINFTVSNADSSHIHIKQFALEYSAYMNLDKRMQTPEGIVHKLQIRVSPDNFDQLIDAIMKESIYTETEDISADDVTAQFVDMEARLKSKRDVEKRYADLLSRAQKVNDILVIESNRRQIQEEIESIEGNLRLLRDQVAYSTIYLTITQKIKEAPKLVEPEKPEMTFMEQVRAALGAGWMGIRYTAVFLLTIWPLIPIVVVAMIMMRMQAKRKKSTQEEDSEKHDEEVVESE